MYSMNLLGCGESPKLHCPPPAWNRLYYVLGGIALFLNKVRYSVQGYKNPRPFSVSDFDQAIAYDMKVVDAWLSRLTNYRSLWTLEGKEVLELGPGADWGVALYLLAGGAARYRAADVNPLAASVPMEFYEHALHAIGKRKGCSKVDLITLRQEVMATKAGKPERLDYRCLPDFNVRVFGRESVDLIVSQAAFEHFDDFQRTAEDIAYVARKDALLVTEIDLNTHTRWLRDNDPLSIYRYPERLYRLLRYPGIPNRLRPVNYVEALLRAGWVDIQVVPLTILSDDYMQQVDAWLASPFRTSTAEMDKLHVVLCARKGL